MIQHGNDRENAGASLFSPTAPALRSRPFRAEHGTRELPVEQVDQRPHEKGRDYRTRAKKSDAKGIFLLTTQTSDWFEGMGFKLSSVSSIPEQRKAIWPPERGSVVYRLEG